MMTLLSMISTGCQKKYKDSREKRRKEVCPLGNNEE